MMWDERWEVNKTMLTPHFAADLSGGILVGGGGTIFAASNDLILIRSHTAFLTIGSARWTQGIRKFSNAAASAFSYVS